MKQVCFDTEAYMTMVLHHSEFTWKERQSTWYSKADYTRMSKENKPTVQLMRNGRLVWDNDLTNNDNNDIYYGDDVHCTRGLEHRVSKRATERKRVRNEAWKSVFDEQSRQEDQGIQNIDDIAMQYKIACNICGFLAYNIGLTDEIHLWNSGYLSTTTPSSSSSRMMIQNNVNNNYQNNNCQPTSSCIGITSFSCSDTDNNNLNIILFGEKNARRREGSSKISNSMLYSSSSGCMNIFIQ